MIRVMRMTEDQLCSHSASDLETVLVGSKYQCADVPRRILTDISSSLAYVEMRIILARMVFNFDMELDPASSDWMNQDAFILWEKPELMVKLTPRT